MSDEFNSSGSQPSKDIRFNQDHFTDGSKMPRDARDSVRRLQQKPLCTQEHPAPAFKHHGYRHEDVDVLPSTNRRTVTLQCKWCGHNWREPR